MAQTTSLAMPDMSRDLCTRYVIMQPVIRFVQDSKPTKKKPVLQNTAHFIFVDLKAAYTTFSHQTFNSSDFL